MPFAEKLGMTRTAISRPHRNSRKLLVAAIACSADPRSIERQQGSGRRCRVNAFKAASFGVSATGFLITLFPARDPSFKIGRGQSYLSRKSH